MEGKYSDAWAQLHQRPVLTVLPEPHRQQERRLSDCSNLCPAGKTGRLDLAQACVAGKYKSFSGSAPCTACPPDTSSVGGAYFCNCNRGYSGPEGGPCSVCPAGTYKDAPGSEQCIDCSAGKYSGFDGATTSATCQDCVAGKYVGISGMRFATDCQICVRGKWSSLTGASACIDCVAGKYSISLGSTQESKCLTCLQGKYSTVPGSDTSENCINCPQESLDLNLQLVHCPSVWIALQGSILFLSDATESAKCRDCPAVLTQAFWGLRVLIIVKIACLENTILRLEWQVQSCA